MNNASLVIHPSDPAWVPSAGTSLSHLIQPTGLIGARLEEKNHFMSGERFLDVITFMGCSPDIRLDPDEHGKPFCHIRLSQKHDTTCRYGEHAHTPRCKHCGSAINDWKERIATWSPTSDDNWRCNNCGNVEPPWNYNWRKSAGFACCFLEITNIYPKEAIPQPSLLDNLKRITGIDWQYFYEY